jgi:PknH-like extracellular domain
MLTRPTLFDRSPNGLISTMTAFVRRLALALAAVTVAACTHTVTGTAERPPPGIDDDSRSPVDVDSVLLKQSQMRAITGAGENLTVIPSMDGKQPVDIDQLARAAPAECRWYFAETQTFGQRIEEFHKTTYQDPPDGAQISQGAAGYLDGATARGAFDDLVGQVTSCASTAGGVVFVGDLTSRENSISLRTGDCGRDYRVKSAVLVEVTFCRFPPSVPEIVMTNLLAHIPD